MDSTTNNISILDSEELIGITRWYLDQEQFGQALIHCKQAMTQDDAPMEAFRLGGKIYAQLGLFEHAKTAFKSFIDATPDALTEIFQYGMVHYDEGDNEAAINIWLDVLKQEPTYPPALFYSALALARTDKASEALKHLDVLIKSAPTDNLYFERGRELINTLEQNKSDSLQGEDPDEQRKLEKYKNEDDRTIN
jgi:tetratricopeptide (TPR) repeat protein